MNTAINQTSRIKNFPIMMYAIVMGMSGLTITYQKADIWLGFPSFIGSFLMIITTLVFIVISMLYSIKIVRYTDVVKNEFSHPVRLNFFAAVSISMLMLAIIYKDVYPTISTVFWYPGMVLHLYLTMYTISFWINRNQDIDHSNPAWFIPIVGNLLVPIAGSDFVSNGILMYFFSVGMFFWLVLFSIIFNRIIFHHQLAVKFIPTLFIFIAPPAVGFIAYIKMYETVDMFAILLFNIAIFFTLLITFMYKSFLKIKFFISWWAFVFPIAAMSIATMLMYHKTKDIVVLGFSYIMVTVTTIIILIVIYQTLKNVKQQNVCIEE